MKKILIWSIVIAIAFSVSLIGAGCKEEAVVEEAVVEEEVAEEAPAEEVVNAGDVTVGVSINALSNINNQTMFELAEKKLKAAGFKTAMVNANGHAVQQSADIENLIQQGVDIIIVQNADKDGIEMQ